MFHAFPVRTVWIIFRVWAVLCDFIAWVVWDISEVYLLLMEVYSNVFPKDILYLGWQPIFMLKWVPGFGISRDVMEWISVLFWYFWATLVYWSYYFRLGYALVIVCICKWEYYCVLCRRKKSQRGGATPPHAPKDLIFHTLCHVIWVILKCFLTWFVGGWGGYFIEHDYHIWFDVIVVFDLDMLSCRELYVVLISGM